MGEYFANIIVEENIIVELKAAENLSDVHEFQLINYLKATELEIGLLLNFGKKPRLEGKYLQIKKIRGNPFNKFAPRSNKMFK